MEAEQGLKRFYGVEAARLLGNHIVQVYPNFDVESYANAVVKGVQGLELKARLKVMMEALRTRLPQNYPAAIEILVASLGPELDVNEGIFKQGWFWGPVVLLVQEYGLDDPNVSLKALNAMTRRHTAEEALRPFIVRHYDLTMRHLWEWVEDESFHVRRLVSEGTRPRLPWAMRLDQFVKDPRPALALLEKLRDDPALYVQKSVANHLNDVAKDHPDLVVEIAEQWMQQNPTPARQWIVRRGLRTLIKAGNTKALAVVGAEPTEGITVSRFEVTPARIQVGDTITLQATLQNESDSTQTLVVDYAIHFVTQRGAPGRKVFKWSTIEFTPGAVKSLEKRHSFRPITTRRYYPGVHRIEIQVNGEVMGIGNVELV
jgi:3-methyladenine DNA glycosylase AlkC